MRANLPESRWPDDQLIMVSALEHWSYCPRQCMLIHLEQVWDENLYTLRGRRVHERVDRVETSEIDGVRIERSLPLFSERLGLVGRADVVEFHAMVESRGSRIGSHGQQTTDNPSPDNAAGPQPSTLDSQPTEIPFPVEYKHGRKRRWGHDDLQLCAQAMCLEEMTCQAVPRGAVYYHGSRRRKEVTFDAALRRRVEETVDAIRDALARRVMPPAVNDARCAHCSLIESCLPAVVGEPARVRRLQRELYAVG